MLAVPGHPFEARASGCNMLIRDGATLVRGADDIIDVLERAPATPINIPMMKEVPPGPPQRAQDTGRLHRDILARLGPSPLAEDQLIRDLELPAADVAPALVNLELEGKINRQPGGLLNLAT